MTCTAPVCVLASFVHEQAAKGVPIEDLIPLLQVEFGADRVEPIVSQDGNVWIRYTPGLPATATEVNLSAAYASQQ